MSQLQIHLFGNPRIARSGQPVAVPRRKAMALIAYLVVTGQSHSRDALGALFWPEHDQAGARANLRRDLFQIKEALGDEILKIDRADVRLNEKADCWVDVREFQNKLALVRRDDASPLCPECLTALTQAVELYTADFMAGFGLPDSPTFDEWQFFEADGLRLQLAAALQRLIDWHTGQGNYEHALEYARRWLALDTLHEPAQQQLIQLYAWSGQYAAALRQYQICAQLLEEELGIEPAEETQKLYEAIKARQLIPPSPAKDHRSVQELKAVPVEAAPNRRAPNLPPQPTPFVGREKELADIRRLLLDKSGHRVITLVGLAGIGKTRLALEVAAQVTDIFPHGVHFVSMDGLQSAQQIIPALAEGMSLRVHDCEAQVQEVYDYLRSRRVLLVIDDLERLSEGSAAILTGLLQAAPEIKMLITSRESLNLSSEITYTVGSLSFPKEAADSEAQAYDAVTMLVQRYQLARPGVALQEKDLADIARICRLVEGMPLAIVLAAGWFEVLSLKEIGDEIEQSLDFLEGQLVDIPERQWSMRAAFDHSWKRLPHEAQQAFTKLSVFRGSFTREAAQQVTGMDLRTLRTLIGKSFVSNRSDERYEVHGLLRQYGEEKLMQSPETDHSHRHRHCQYFADFLEKQMIAVFNGQQLAAVARIKQDLQNVHQAWQWAVDQRKIDVIYRASEALSWFYRTQSRFLDGASAFEQATEALRGVSGERQVGPALARVLVNLGWFYLRLGRLDEADTVLHESSALHEQLPIDPLPGYATDPLLPWAVIAHMRGNYELAAERGQQALVNSQRNEHLWNRRVAYYVLGLAALAQNDCDAAERFVTSAYNLSHTLGDRWFMAYCFSDLGNISLANGDLTTARDYYEDFYAISSEFDDREGMARALERLGEVAARENAYEEAQSMFHQSLMLSQRTSAQAQKARSYYGLGVAALGLSLHHEASRNFYHALQITTESGFVPLTLSILIRIAELHLQSGQGDHGLRLLAWVRRHGRSEPLVADRVHVLVERYAPETDIVSQVAAKPTESLEMTVARALASLTEVPLSQRSRGRTSRIDVTGEWFSIPMSG